MKYRKYLLFLLFVAASLLLIRPVTAEAAGGATMLPDESVLVNYEDESVEITVGENTKIFYSDSATAINWEVAPVVDGKAIFDFSWIKPSTTARIYIKGDKDSLVTARYIEAQEQLSIQFVGDLSAADVVDIDAWKQAYKAYDCFSNDTGYLLFFIKKAGAGTAFFSLDRIEWRKGETGKWRSFEELNFAEMNARGATLQFRVKAVNDEDTKDKKSGSRYSSVAKLNLQKISAAPVISINSAAMTLGIRNGMEYSLNQKDWFLVPVYVRTATGNQVSVPVSDFDILPSTNIRVTAISVPMVMQVTANTRIDKKLVEANPDRYICRRDDGGNITGVCVYVRMAASANKAASRMVEVILPFAKGKPDMKHDISVSYQQSKTGMSGVVLVNNTLSTEPVDYQYAIVENPYDMTPEELSSVKWSTLKAEKTVKVGSSKALPEHYLIFRTATAGRDELPSEFEIYPYPIRYDKVSFAAISTTSLYPGGEITAVTGNNAIYGEITYTWERSDVLTGAYTKITSGTGYEASKYTIQEGDIGYYIRVTISNVSSAGETAQATSKSTGKIAKDPTKQ